jgi:hypothetical protein
MLIALVEKLDRLLYPGVEAHWDEPECSSSPSTSSRAARST